MKTKKRGFFAYSMDLLRHKRLITLANILCNAVIFSHQAAVNYFIMRALNALEGTRGAALDMAAPYLAGILAVALIRVLAIMVCAALDALRAYYYQNRARSNIVRLLLSREDILSVAGRSGALFEVIDSDVPISTFPAELLTEVSGHFIYTLIALTMLLTVNWQLTLFIFIPLSAAIYAIQRLSERMKERRQENRAAHDAESGFIGDVSASVMAIKAAGSQAPVLGRYSEVNANRRAAALKDALHNVKINVLLTGSVYVGSAIMMFVAARLMAGGSFGIGDFSLFIANLGTLADCVNRIVELIAESRRAEVSYERIIDAVGAQNAAELAVDAPIALRQVHEPNRTYARRPLQSFEARNLCYDYGDGHGFSSVSFHVAPGELMVVAGGVGSGKSTLLSVLMGLLPAQRGEMILGGKQVVLGERTPIGIAGAPPRGGFFSGELRENLCLGFPAAQNDMMAALSAAALGGLVADDPRGCDLEMGSRGGRLSGGQLQRLALARVYVRGAQLNVIDDCVSALDEDTRREVLTRLSAHLRMASSSAIIATNDRAFLEAADQILFMERGRVIARGTFSQLMENEAFRRLAACGGGIAGGRASGGQGSAFGIRSRDSSLENP